MKLVIDSIEAATRRPDDTYIFPHTDVDGNAHTVELSRKAQNQLLQVLLATPPVADQGKPLRFFEPRGVKLMATSLGRIGLSFFLNETMAIHFALEKELADGLQKLLAGVEWTEHTKQ